MKLYKLIEYGVVETTIAFIDNLDKRLIYYCTSYINTINYVCKYVDNKWIYTQRDWDSWKRREYRNWLVLNKEAFKYMVKWEEATDL